MIDTPEGRVLLTTYADGKFVRITVDPNQKPLRKPRKPFARATIDRLDKTRKKRF